MSESYQNGSEVFLVLRDQQIQGSQKHPPSTFYIKGLMENNEFVPKSSILGNGELATKGRYGWLELGSCEFFPMESDKRAKTPFVKGYMTPEGFFPSARDVFSEP